MSEKTAWWIAAETEPAEPGEAHNYLEVRNHIAARIDAGDVPQGARLPSERQLQGGIGAARGTVRAALFQLEAEGVIYRKDRSGWYVAPKPIVYDPTRWESFMAYVQAQGRSPRTETLDVEEVAATPALTEVFGGEAGRTLYRLRRRRHIDDRAVLIETIHVDPAVAPELPDQNLDGSLTRVLRDHYGVSVVRNRVEMQPCALIQDVAAALRIKPGLPGLLIRRTSYDAAGRVVEYDDEYWRHDALKVQVDIQLENPPVS